MTVQPSPAASPAPHAGGYRGDAFRWPHDVPSVHTDGHSSRRGPRQREFNSGGPTPASEISLRGGR